MKVKVMMEWVSITIIYRYFVNVRQTGIMGFTTTGHPLVGQITPGHYISVGFNGHGMPIAHGWYVVLQSFSSLTYLFAVQKP